MSPEVLKLRLFRQTSAIFLTVQKKKSKTVHSSHQTCCILLRWVACGIISSQILLMVHEMKSKTTLPRKVDSQQNIAHAFSQVAVSLFYCVAKIRRPRPKEPLKLVSQGFFSQFSVFVPSNMLLIEVWCPLAIAYVPRSTQVTFIPANQCHFPHSAKKEE